MKTVLTELKTAFQYTLPYMYNEQLILIRLRVSYTHINPLHNSFKGKLLSLHYKKGSHQN